MPEYVIDVAHSITVDPADIHQHVFADFMSELIDSEEPTDSDRQLTIAEQRADEMVQGMAQRVLTTLRVGSDLLSATKLYETLVDLNQDIIRGGGYIRLQVIVDGNGIVLAQRAKDVQW